MTISRRNFLGAGGVVALVPVATDAEVRQRNEQQTHADGARSGPDRANEPYRFFNAPEAAFIEAAVDRLIPPDAVGPSAGEADVPRYIDLQLAGAWGAGEKLYRSGPWPQGKPNQGYQLPFTPAELFRTALRGIRNDLEAQHLDAFEKLQGAEQDRYLTLLQTTARDLEGVPSNVFFESFLAMTVEGYFCDPVYGGNRDMAAWKMIGFPGAYADYYALVDRYNEPFDGAPLSLAEDGRGHVHVMAGGPTRQLSHKGK